MKSKFTSTAVCLVIAFNGSAHAEESRIRNAFVAGQFYPANSEKLNRTIDDFLKNAAREEIPTDPVALVVPHAGYEYSGQTAAVAYKQLIGRSYDTVIVIGLYHRASFDGASIWRGGSWQTPLGRVPIDTDLGEAIARESSLFEFTEDFHWTEHSIEVQIPFLQKVLNNFKLVPILMSEPSISTSQALAKAILKHSAGKKILIIASTDMSHYYEDSIAKKMDRLTLDLLKKKDSEGLVREMNSKRSELCGIAAALTVVELSKLLPDTEFKILHYANSGDTTGDWSRVVGYGASILYRPGSGPEGAPLSKAEESVVVALTGVQKEELLKIARQTLQNYLRNQNIPEFKTKDPVLRKDAAVFVTLKENGQLRGCVGSLAPEGPLDLAVRDKAIQAATEDPRFRPVQIGELDKIHIEVSVLSAPKKINGPDEIILGTHGVIVRRGGRSGVFLPQVATETLWTKEEFLNELCSQKAGLPADAWQDPATELDIFTVQAFEEPSR